MAVSKRLRFEILRRDGHRCRYCGVTATETELVVDHVVPVALGGLDVAENLVAACQPCNSGKSSVPADAQIVADVAADALRWAAAIREAQMHLCDELYVHEESVEAIDEAWSKWTWDADKKPIPRPADWQESIEKIAATGLPLEVMEWAVRHAMSGPASVADKWRYFCGICWKKADQMHRIARDVIEAAS